ncbi:MAG: hypothetical protein ACI8T1_000684 [Verrucomicrobiales bacterium]|jgi:hypothetical protein
MRFKDIFTFSVVTALGLSFASAQLPNKGESPTDAELLASLPSQIGVYVEFISTEKKAVEDLLY